MWRDCIIISYNIYNSVGCENRNRIPARINERACVRANEAAMAIKVCPALGRTGIKGRREMCARRAIR